MLRTKTLMLRSDLRDYSDAYIVVKWNNTVNKKTFTALILKRVIMHIQMQMLLILQMIMRKVKKVGF